MCKRNSPDKYEPSMGCVRETPKIKKKKRLKEEANTGSVREPLRIRETKRKRKKPARDVKEKLPTER